MFFKIPFRWQTKNATQGTNLIQLNETFQIFQKFSAKLPLSKVGQTRRFTIDKANGWLLARLHKKNVNGCASVCAEMFVYKYPVIAGVLALMMGISEMRCWV